MLAATLFLGAPSGSRAQVMEPLSYTNAPIGLNFLIGGYGYLWGDVLTDPSLPIKDADAKVHTAVLTYARVLDFWGQSGTVALLVPYAWLSASGEVAGQSRSVERSGLADITLRASVNLYGAPALSLQEFRDYRQDTIVGVSLLGDRAHGPVRSRAAWSTSAPTAGRSSRRSAISKALGTMDAGGRRERHLLHRQRRIPGHQRASSRNRCMASRDTRSTISTRASGRRWTPRITPAAAPR